MFFHKIVPDIYKKDFFELQVLKFLLRLSGKKSQISMNKTGEKPKEDAKELKEIFVKLNGTLKTQKTFLDDHIDPNIKGVPVDYSFRNVFFLSELEQGTPREYRVGIPKKTSSGKYISRYCLNFWTSPDFPSLLSSLLANYNRLTNLEDIKSLVDLSFHKPEMIAWLDVSFNEITTISNELLVLKNLKILYLHGNKIKSFFEVNKLKELERLRTLTLHGNPIEDCDDYRTTVVGYLPQLINFDFSLVTRE